MEQTETTIKTEIATLTEGMEFLSVTTRPEYECLLKQENAAVILKRQIESYWDGTKEKPGPVKKAYDTWKDLTTKRGEMLKPLEAFLKAVNRIGGSYLAEEQRKAQEQAVALAREAARIREAQEAEARKAADALKARQEAELAAQRASQEAERKAQAAERARKEAEFKNSPAEKARIAAEFKAKQDAERAEQERQAEILRVRQAEERAEQERRAKAQMLDTSQVPQAPTRADPGEGRTTVQIWTYDVEDEALVPRKYLMLDHKAIKAVVTALKDKAGIAGIKPRRETGIRRIGK